MTQPFVEAHPEDPPVTPHQLAAQAVMETIRKSLHEQATILAADKSDNATINPLERDASAFDILAQVKTYLLDKVVGLHHLSDEYVEYFLDMPENTTQLTASVQNVLEDIRETLHDESVTLATDKAEATETRFSPFVRDDEARTVLALVIGALQSIAYLYQLEGEYIAFTLKLSIDS